MFDNSGIAKATHSSGETGGSRRGAFQQAGNFASETQLTHNFRVARAHTASHSRGDAMKSLRVLVLSGLAFLFCVILAACGGSSKPPTRYESDCHHDHTAPSDRQYRLQCLLTGHWWQRLLQLVRH